MGTATGRARAVFSALHWGLEATTVRDVVRPRGAPTQLVAIGRLVRIELASGSRVVPLDRPIWVATDLALSNAWLVSEVSMDPDSPQGMIRALTYDARKGPNDAHWRHAFWWPGPLLEAGQIQRGESTYRITPHGFEY